MPSDVGKRKAAAEQAMRSFQTKNNLPGGWREEDRDTVCVLIGTAPDGREYSIGYETGAKA